MKKCKCEIGLKESFDLLCRGICTKSEELPVFDKLHGHCVIISNDGAQTFEPLNPQYDIRTTNREYMQVHIKSAPLERHSSVRTHVGTVEHCSIAYRDLEPVRNLCG